jgi:fructokinase
MGLTAKLPSKQQFLEVNGVGEPLIDDVTSPEGTSEHPGGSPANVAYGLGRLALVTKGSQAVLT